MLNQVGGPKLETLGKIDLPFLFYMNRSLNSCSETSCKLKTVSSLILVVFSLLTRQGNNFGPTERKKEDLRGFGQDQDVPRRFDVGALLNMTTGWSLCHLSALVRYFMPDVCFT